MLSYQEVLKLVRELPEDEQALLVNDLLTSQNDLPSREQLIQELVDLRELGAFENTVSLYGKFPNPAIAELNTDALYADLNAMGQEWEQELNEFESD